MRQTYRCRRPADLEERRRDRSLRQVPYVDDAEALLQLATELNLVAIIPGQPAPPP